MLEQIINLVKQFGKKTVIENKDIPNEHNEDILADATKTIGNGFQHLMAGGGFQNILDLFKGGQKTTGGGIGGLLKNPIVSMMIGYFVSKLVKNYKLSPAAASNVGNKLIPDVLGTLINRTTSHEPENDAFDFNDLIGSLTGGKVATSESSPSGFNFQNLLDHFVGGNNGNANEIQDVTGTLSRGTQEYEEEQRHRGGGGLMDTIRGLFSRQES
jgi:hypothetical protein